MVVNSPMGTQVATVRPIALTLGEPAGVGPDLAIAVWRRRFALDLPPFYILAEREFFARRAKLTGAPIRLAESEPAEAAAMFASALPIVDIGTAVTAGPGHPDATSAPAAIASIRLGVLHVLAGEAAAIVTNPVAKNVLYQSGFTEPGHTEYLGRLAAAMTGGSVHPVMMLWSPELAVVPVT